MPSVSTNDWSAFIRIMIFYIVLTYLVLPLIFYYLMGKTKKAAGHGFVVGSVVSLLLWFVYGSKMI
jgi:hypothetical protein